MQRRSGHKEYVGVGVSTQVELAPIASLEDTIFGTGMNCVTGMPSNVVCVSKFDKQAPSNTAQDKISAAVVQDSSSYSDLMSAAASLSASGLTWSASASVSYLSQQTGSDTYLSYVALREGRSQTIWATFADAVVSDEALNYLRSQGPSAFVAKFGTHCAIGVAYGGSFAARIRIEAHSASDKSAISATMSGSISAFGGGMSANASFSEERQTITQSYSINADASIVGFDISGFSSIDPDGMMNACTNVKYVHDDVRKVDGNAVAFVCQTWDQFPQVQAVLDALNQPTALSFADAQSNLAQLATEYAALQYIVGTCINLQRYGQYAIPSYGGVVQAMLNTASQGQSRITALTLEQIRALTPQTIAPYLISAQMRPLLNAIGSRQVMVQANWYVDAAFRNPGWHSTQIAASVSSNAVPVATTEHVKDWDNIWNLAFYVVDNGGGAQLQAHTWWNNGDTFDGPTVDLATASFPTGVSSATWTGAAWNQLNVSLVGYDPSDFFGWR